MKSKSSRLLKTLLLVIIIVYEHRIKQFQFCFLNTIMKDLYNAVIFVKTTYCI